jgi:hypothetical protein
MAYGSGATYTEEQRRMPTMFMLFPAMAWCDEVRTGFARPW